MPKKISEKRATWHFELDECAAQTWRWVKAQPTGTIERSKATFASLDACAKDASAHGYGDWKNDERRQSEVRNDVLETADLSAAVRSLRLAPATGTAAN